MKTTLLARVLEVLEARGAAGPALRAEVETRLAALPQPLRDAWLTLEE